MEQNELNDVQQTIEAYLVEQVETGSPYFKSKYIADALDLSSKTVGTNLGLMQDKTERVVIEKWSGGSSGVTWVITPPERESEPETEPEVTTRRVVQPATHGSL